MENIKTQALIKQHLPEAEELGLNYRLLLQTFEEYSKSFKLLEIQMESDFILCLFPLSLLIQLDFQSLTLVHLEHSFLQFSYSCSIYFTRQVKISIKRQLSQ